MRGEALAVGSSVALRVPHREELALVDAGPFAILEDAGDAAHGRGF